MLVNVLSICTDEELVDGEEDGDIDGTFIYLIFPFIVFHMIICEGVEV